MCQISIEKNDCHLMISLFEDLKMSFKKDLAARLYSI